MRGVASAASPNSMAKFTGSVSEYLEDVFEHQEEAPLMGVERAVDATPGGDREFGEFGQQQSDFVALLNSDENPFPGQPPLRRVATGFLLRLSPLPASAAAQP